MTHVDGSTGEPPPDGEAPAFDDEDRLYIQTYVSRFGEEGAPGSPSQPVLIERPGATVTVRLMQPSTNTHNITHTRLYRSVTVSGEADYLLVAEVPISQPNIGMRRAMSTARCWKPGIMTCRIRTCRGFARWPTASVPALPATR